MTFSIADFRFSIKGLKHMSNIFQILSPRFPSGNLKSEIQNLKWGGIVAIALTFAFGEADQLPAKGLKGSDEEKLFLHCIERSAFGA